ncbi:MAG: hypothetical protein KDE27_32370 [Planctomycetes bacterium]|nr:hypothetical protein [Planctomycetota bacterium]
MAGFLNDLIVQLKGIWNRLDGGQRLVVASVMFATLAGLGAIVWFAGRPSYEAVYTATSAEDLTGAKRALEQNNIEYVPDSSGMSFLVDAAKVGLARIALREAGIMSESRDDGLGASSIIDDAETKAWKLANASIARAEAAVRNVEGVTAVNITASPARRTRAFVDKDRESRPTATVLLKLRVGSAFVTLAQTAASLTASQLGIPLENVTVTNAVGGARWRHDPDRAAGGGASEFMGQQRAMAREKMAAAQELLDQAWPNKASVLVNVELDPNWEIVSEKVLPTQELVRSEKTSKETSDQSSGSAGNRFTNSTAGAGDPATKNATKNETKDREFVTEIGERRSGKMAPEIKRMTVAVVYDRSLEQLDGFSKDELTRMVKTSVGWDANRDAENDFSVMPGDLPTFDPGELITSAPGALDIALDWAPTVGQVFGVIVVVLFLRGLFKRASPRAATPATSELASVPVAERNLSPEEQQKRMRREIERAIASDPAALAKLLESWLMEQSAS